MAEPVTTTLMIGSTLLGVYGKYKEGREAKKAADFEAGQLEEQASARLATGTRQAYETRRQGDIVSSDARAAMAAMGGTTTDAGAVEQLAALDTVTDYNVLATLYDARTESEGLRKQAEATRKSGRIKERAGKFAAASTLIQGGAAVFPNLQQGWRSSKLDSLQYGPTPTGHRRSWGEKR